MQKKKKKKKKKHKKNPLRVLIQKFLQLVMVVPLPILSKCAIWGSKKSKFIKKLEAKRLLNNLGIRTPLSKIPLLGDALF